MFEPKELSTAQQKSMTYICSNKKDFLTSLSIIRLDTDASRLCAIMRFEQVVAHSNPDMDNTVFPSDEQSQKMKLMIATKFQKVN